MAKSKRGSQSDDEVVETESQVEDDSAALRQSFVMLAVSVINGLLIIRFIQSALDANPSNVFASFIYTMTEPTVSPFRGLLGETSIDETGARIEAETLLAMVIVWLIGWGITRLISLGRTRPEIA
jgi:hypothetical protein